MLTKSKASACILTLFLSFVLSGYPVNLMNCKLKPYISYGLVSPHLENPADFPKPVFIWRGSCQHTPQLIYINVVHKPTKNEKPTARKSTFGFSNRISPRSKNQKSFHFPTATQKDKLLFKQKNKTLL